MRMTKISGHSPAAYAVQYLQRKHTICSASSERQSGQGETLDE